MTIQEFFDAYLGLWVETNKGEASTNDQCVDLWRAYNRKVIAAPDMFGNAVDFWTNYPLDFYTKIPNTPTGIPQLGDVIIWGTKYGKYGHIAVCTDIADTKTFTAFGQNDPVGSACHYQPHNYTGVLGWLRPKNQEAVLGHPDQNIALQVIVEGHSALPDGDPLKQGNLEGYCRAITAEHLNHASLSSKAKELDGFIAKWVEEYKLSMGSNLVEIETEMVKLPICEDLINQYRSTIEECVGHFVSDTALFTALKAIKEDKESLMAQLSECQAKLSKTKILATFTIGPFLVKICENR